MMNRHLSGQQTNMSRGDSRERRSRLTGGQNEGGDAATVSVLNQALLVAQITLLRCKRQYRLALRHHSPPLAADALEHANEAKLQADRITERIVQFGGKPDESPDALPHQSRIEQDQGVAGVIAEHLLASRAAVESYHEFAAFFAPFDPITHTLIEEIAGGEQERATDLARLQDPSSNQAGVDHPVTETLG
jgi:bacterioferritin (cytochrome b1)